MWREEDSRRLLNVGCCFGNKASLDLTHLAFCLTGKEFQQSSLCSVLCL